MVSKKIKGAPWRASTLLGKAWFMALAGTTQRSLRTLCTKEGKLNKFDKLIAALRSGSEKEFRWKVVEGKYGRFSIVVR